MQIMENLIEDFISNWEMDDEDFFNQSNIMIPLNEEVSLRNSDIFVHHQAIFSSESDHSPSLNNPSCSSSLQLGGAAFAMTNLEQPQSSSFSSGYVLSFANTVVEPVSTSTTRVQLLAERKRRQQLTKSIIELSAIIPGLKKNDKVSVMREAIKYVKELKERVKELENEKRKECVDSMMKKVLHCTEEQLLPEVKATVLEKEVLIGILCENQNQTFLIILSLLNDLHISINSSSILPFGTSTLKITIIAQMDDEYNMTIDDLVKALRHRILNLK